MDNEQVVSSSSKWAKVWEECIQILRHTVVLVMTLISIWVVHLTLSYSLGKDAKFFDRIPISYVIDVGHLAALIKFIYHIVRSFKDHD